MLPILVNTRSLTINIGKDQHYSPPHGLTNPLKQSAIISMLHLQNRVHERLYLMRPNNAVFITFIPSKMNFRISELGKFGR